MVLRVLLRLEDSKTKNFQRANKETKENGEGEEKKNRYLEGRGIKMRPYGRIDKKIKTR